MNALAPKYRVSTTQVVQKDIVLAIFTDVLLPPLTPDTNVWHCIDGSSFVFKPCKVCGLFYVELQCQFHAQREGSVGFGLLPRMIAFCKAHGGTLKVLRNNSIHPACEGMYSDVFWSEPYRIARHLADEPNDHQAKAHFSTR
jgi:hypothetical protein